MIPQKIQPYFKIMLQKMDNDNTIIEGMLTCCNSHEFEVYAVGEIRHSFFSKMCLIPEDDKIVLEVHCKKCGKVISVFDNSCDGYEQCGKKHYAHTTTKPLVCKNCSYNDFSVVIRYEYPDVQELKELEITETDNAFTWIWITLECNKCGDKHKNFIDFETS